MQRTQSILASLVGFCAICGGPVAAEGIIDAALAKSYFDEAAEMSSLDSGTLWGRSLYGPMLLVDRKTRSVVANEPAPGATLHADGGVYFGKLPANVAVTSVRASHDLRAVAAHPSISSQSPPPTGRMSSSNPGSTNGK